MTTKPTRYRYRHTVEAVLNAEREGFYTVETYDGHIREIYKDKFEEQFEPVPDDNGWTLLSLEYPPAGMSVLVHLPYSIIVAQLLEGDFYSIPGQYKLMNVIAWMHLPFQLTPEERQG